MTRRGRALVLGALLTAAMLVAACSPESAVVGSPEPAALPPQLADFITPFRDAVRAGRDREAESLAEAHRYLLRDAFESLVGQGTTAQASGRASESEVILREAGVAAQAIATLAKDDSPLRRIAAMRGWTAEQWAAKARAERFLGVARTAYEQGRYADVSDVGEAALSIGAAIGDVRDQSDVLHVIGAAAGKLGDYDRAAGWHTRALELARAARDREGEGRALIDLGDIDERRKDHDAATRAYKQALDVLVPPEDWREAARALRQLGDVYVSHGDFGAAFESYAKALDLAEGAGDLERVAEANDYLGYFSRELGDCGAAVRYHETALRGAERITDPNTQAAAVARANNHLGLCHDVFARQALDVRDSEAARKEFAAAVSAEAAALEAATLAQDRWRQGYVLRALAAILRNSSEVEGGAERDAKLGESLAYASRAVALAREMKEPEWEGLALHQLAIDQARLGRLDEAQGAVAGALTIWRKIGDLKSEAYGYRLIADELDLPAERISEALADYDRAIAVDQRIEALDEISDIQYRRGLVFQRARDLGHAEEAYRASIATLESIRSRLSLAEHKLSFFAARQKPYEALVNLLIDRYRRSGDVEDAVRAFDVSERARARVLLDLIQSARDPIRAGIDEEALQRRRELQSRYDSSVRALELNRDPGSAEPLQRQLRTAQRELEVLDQELRQRYPRYAQLSQLDPLTLPDVRRGVLQPGDCLVEYFVTDDRLQIFVVRPDGLRAVETVPIGRRDLTRRIAALREPFEMVKQTGSLETLDKFDLDAANELYLRVMAPVVPHVAGARSLIIVPHGPLFYLPFELLVVSRPEPRGTERIRFGRFERAQYLLETAPPIVYALSASLLDPRLANQPRPAAAAQAFLGFGNPIGDGDERHATTIPVQGGSVALGPLPFAESEVRRVAAIYGNGARAYLRNDASKARFVAQAPRFRLLLLSTHGVLDEGDPMLSMLVFARDAGAADLQVLRAYEIFDLSLDARVVVLSACEVGLGKLQSGEGLLGFARAFIYAGASSLSVTLWSVDDRASSSLVIGFFRALRREPEQAARALRQAKLAVLHSRERVGGLELSLANPFFWAPFILIDGPPSLRR